MRGAWIGFAVVMSTACRGEDPLESERWLDPSAAVATVADSVHAFDVNAFDLAGPSGATYGKEPEIIVRSAEGALFVLAHDYGDDVRQPIGATLLRLDRTAETYIVTQVQRLANPVFLDRLVGFDRSPNGDLFIASAIDEDDIVDANYPANDQYRQGIVHVSQLSPEGEVVRQVDLDVARTGGPATGRVQQVINPMVAASGRLAYGDGHIAVTHGINTVPDPEIDNRRHQKKLTTVVDMTTGTVVRDSTTWVSHSFDHRLIFDGEAFVEMHLGDAFPRHVTVGRTPLGSDGRVQGYPVFGIKGGVGANVTRTRLGGLVALPDEGFSHLAVFVGERTVGTADVGGVRNVAGSRDVGMTRFVRGFTAQEGPHLDPSLPDTMTAAEVTVSMRWLTDHDATEGRRHADRPHVVGLGADRYLVLWEEWDLGPTLSEETFDGTFGMIIDSSGRSVVPVARLSEDRLPRGDDAVAVRMPGALRKAGAWVTADFESGAMTVHVVDSDLQYETFEVP
ncbi:MAG: hypothetical protein AAGA48_30865 [Myxococcota bacterium]